MRDDWLQTTIGEFSPFSYGKALPERARRTGPFPVISSAGITGTHVEPLVKSSGVVIGRKGTVGKVTFSPVAFWPIDTAFFVADDPEQRDIRFTYYLLQTLGLERMNSDSAVPGLNRDNAHALQIWVPRSVSKQRRIAQVLASLDSKIELSLRVNQTLEAMAQAIFRSWFVDFDPVKAKIAAKAEGRDPLRAAMSAISGKTDAELDVLPLEQHAQLAATATLFPDEMVESELGEIPNGWKCDSFGAIALLAKGSINPLIYPDRVFEHYSLPAFDDGRLPVLEKGAQIKSNKTSFARGVVLQSKLNPHIPRVWYPLGAGKDAVCSTEFLPWIAKKPVSPPFLYCLLTSPQFEILIRSLVTGTSNSHQRVKPDQVAALPVLIPPSEILTSFEIAVAPLFRAVECGTQQGRTLAELRDTLLPNLLSGALSVGANHPNHDEVSQ